MRATLQTIVWAYLGACLVAVIEAAVIDWETTGGILLISLVTLPSIVGFALCATYLPGRPRMKYFAFFAPALFVVVACANGLLRETVDLQVYDLIKWFAVLYLFQLGAALLLLLEPWWQRREAA